MKEFILQGLGCANCALKIENELKKNENFPSVSLNFATAKLRLEVSDNYAKNVRDEVERVVHLYESDVLVIEQSTDNAQIAGNTSIKPKILWLTLGAIAFVAGIIFRWPFYISGDIAFVLFLFSYIWLGAKVIFRAVRNITKGKIFDENFLMTIATIGALVIGEYAGAAAIMLFYQVGDFFQELAVRKSKKEIAGLMDIRPDYANLQTNGQVSKVSPESVNIGDIIIVKPGEKIPLDGIVVDGESMVDTSALTGESVPRKVSKADNILSGCINQSGVLTIEVTQTFGESTVSKIIDLVENAASKKATLETFITKFARYYTPVVVILAVLIAVVPPLFWGGVWFEWIHRSIVLLIISCPCALVLSIPLGFFGGIGAASKRGILVKGGNYLEALANLEYVVFDKTGTLTKGVFKVTSMQASNGFSEAELLEAAAYAETFSNHPIALSIMQEYGKSVDKDGLSQYTEIAGHGVSVVANGRTILVGNEKLMTGNSIEFSSNNDFGTKVHVAADGVYIGCITISDEIKPDSYKAISGLRDLGVKRTVMLTGDTLKVAQAVAAELKIDELHASLLPQEKVEKVEELIKQKHHKKTLAFVGDGINDAPVLAMADVGIAMGGLGSDAAIEAADVVLMTDEPQKLLEAIKIARFTRRIVWQNIVFALTVQILFIILGSIGVASIWEAVFADVGVSLIAVFNTWRILKF